MPKILVIDQELGIRTLLDTQFRRRGYDVVLAESGREGLTLFRREHPDVVVLDLKLPGMDGVTVLKLIRRVNLRQPVIVLTSPGTSKTKQQVDALGVTAFVEKRISLYRLGDSLTRLFNNLDTAA